MKYDNLVMPDWLHRELRKSSLTAYFILKKNYSIEKSKQSLYKIGWQIIDQHYTLSGGKPIDRENFDFLKNFIIKNMVRLSLDEIDVDQRLISLIFQNEMHARWLIGDLLVTLHETRRKLNQSNLIEDLDARQTLTDAQEVLDKYLKKRLFS